MTLAGVRVVLVGPREPGNVGSTARAIANFGLGELVLVAPPGTDDAARWGRAIASHPSARALAAGGSTVLDRVRAAGTLDEALAGTVRAAGFTARLRGRIEPVPISPREAAAELASAVPSGPVALVFGPEDHGLVNADLDRCGLLVRIQADPGYPVLNLAQSVVVAAYEIHQALAPAASGGATDAQVTHDELELLYERFRTVLVGVRFLRRRERQGMVTLRGFLGRTSLQRREFRFLMGALGRIERELDRRPAITGPARRGALSGTVPEEASEGAEKSDRVSVQRRGRALS